MKQGKKKKLQKSSIFTTIKQKVVNFWQWYKGCFLSRPWYIKTLSTIATLFVLFFLYLGAVDINLFGLFGKSPGWAEVKAHRTAQASELWSADGVMLGKYFNENRTPVEYKDVTADFWKALIDTEDERFYDHWGIDPLGLLGAAKDAVTGKGGRGASTLTQQLAKNMFRARTSYGTGFVGKIPGMKILIMKTKEWILATKLELYFAYTLGRKEGKNEILTQYANTVDFGHNAFGIKTASKTYFAKDPKDLSTQEAAVLVGMLKATTYYNPKSNPENSRARRNVVLDNMVSHGDLSRDKCEMLKQTEIDCSEFNVEDNYDGQAKYFREAVAKHIKHLAETDENFPKIDLYNDGVKIYTTLDTRMQTYAEEAARKQMKQVQQNFNNHWSIRRTQDNFMPGAKPWQDEKHNEIAGFIEDKAKKTDYYQQLKKKFDANEDSINYYMNKPHIVKLFDYDKGEIERMMSTMDSIRYMVSFMHCAFVAMEPQTGHVKAWVGDIDFDHWKYDKVTAMRQPGSTFKLFVYSEAIEQGMTPCTKRRDEYFAMTVWDSQQKKEVTWAPTNANGYFTGDSMPLRSAFAQSINSVAVRLGQECSIKSIAETARNMGIQSPLDDTAPSLALGSSDVTLLELANAYCTVANNGMARKEAILITRIVDRDGEEIYNSEKQSNELKQAIQIKTAYLMTQMLQAGMRDAGGTSMSMWGYVGKALDTEFGGKTGTSNNHSDAWFMGVSPNLVVGAWVGGEYRSIHFRTGALGQGSRTALPICGYFLQSVFSDPAFQKYHGKFKKPEGEEISRADFECSYYASRRDTLDADSLAIDGADVIMDEEGNTVTIHRKKYDDGEPGEGGNADRSNHHTDADVDFNDL